MYVYRLSAQNLHLQFHLQVLYAQLPALHVRLIQLVEMPMGHLASSHSSTKMPCITSALQGTIMADRGVPQPQIMTQMRNGVAVQVCRHLQIQIIVQLCH